MKVSDNSRVIRVIRVIRVTSKEERVDVLEK
jgi:hypothetical protein